MTADSFQPPSINGQTSPRPVQRGLRVTALEFAISILAVKLRTKIFAAFFIRRRAELLRWQKSWRLSQSRFDWILPQSTFTDLKRGPCLRLKSEKHGVLSPADKKEYSLSLLCRNRLFVFGKVVDEFTIDLNNDVTLLAGGWFLIATW